MDVLHNLPPAQEGQTILESDYTGFALSLQGAAHQMTDPPIPCQDYSDIRYLKQENIMLAAIADGVGSCRLSHWGAYTAVNAALDCAGQALERLAEGKAMKLDSCGNEQMKAVLLKAFKEARDAVEALADETQQLPFNFQSTLTLAVYDGKDLFFGHAGDDGIVVQTQDGGVEMLTIRQKGDEMGSVYPLQSGEKTWHFGRAAKPVAAFLMATDGVLDAFVANRPDYYEVNYSKGVCYAFMEDAVYTLGENLPDAPQKALESYLKYLKSPSYQEQVTDDLTMVAIVSRPLLAASKHPKFNMEIWNTIQQESNAARRLLLSHKPFPSTKPGDMVFGSKVPKQEKPVPSQPERQEPERQEPGRGEIQREPGGWESEEWAHRNREPRRQEAKSQEQKISCSKIQCKTEKRGVKALTALLILLLAMGAAAGGFAAGRWLFPEIRSEDYQSLCRKAQDLIEENQALTEQIQNIQEANREQEKKLAQPKAPEGRNNAPFWELETSLPEGMEADIP